MPRLSTDFFATGGTLSRTASSYIPRAADEQLFQALSHGRFSFLLNSRQMGKSSLSVRTMARLEKEGARCALIDLTRIGGRNVNPDQWYATICREISVSLGLKLDLQNFWRANLDESPMRRFFRFLREIVLESIEGQFVLFIDEVDATQNLSFNVDEFFAGIREIYNCRASDPEFMRITVCLVGVALPSDLISDPRVTPFNVGERIYLQDFSLAEVSEYAPQLGANGLAIIHRLFYWTSGHPFLTQSLCAAIAADGGIHDAKGVDRIVRQQLLVPNARETNINLTDVGARVLNVGLGLEHPATMRAETLSTYDQVLRGREVVDNESVRSCAILKLSGIVRSDGARLYVRNRIYQMVFDRKWVRRNLPDQELRRQKRAYLSGFLMAGSVGGLVIASIVALAITSVNQARRADENARIAQAISAREKSARLEAEKFSFEAYRMAVRITYDDYLAKRDGEAVRSMIDLEHQPQRGWEFYYLKHHIHRLGSFIQASNLRVRGLGFTSEKELVTLSLDHKITVWNIQTLHAKFSFRLPVLSIEMAVIPGADAVIVGDKDGSLTRYSLKTGAVDWHLAKATSTLYSVVVSGDGKSGMAYCGFPNGGVLIFDTTSGKELQRVDLGRCFMQAGAISADGSRFVVGGTIPDAQDAQVTFQAGFQRGRKSPEWQIKTLGGLRASSLSYSFDGHSIVAGYTSGSVGWEAVDTGKPVTQRTFKYGYVVGTSGMPGGKSWFLTQSEHVSLVRPDGSIALVRSVPDKILRSVVSPDGRFAATTGMDGGLCIWNLSESEMDSTSESLVSRAGTGGGEAGIFSADGSDLYRSVAGAPGQPSEWREYCVADGRDLGDVVKGLYYLAVSPSQKFYAVSDLSGTTVKILRASDRRVTAVVHSGKPILFSEDDRWVVLSEFEDLTSTIRIFDVGTGSKLSEYRGMTGHVGKGAFSPDGRHLALAGSVIHLFDLVAHKVVASLVGHSNDVSVLKYSRDGALLFSAANDATLLIWDASTGNLLHTLPAKEGMRGGGVLAIQELFGGKRLAVALESEIDIWDIETGKLMLSIPREPSQGPICQTADGSILSVGPHGAIYRLAVEP